MKLIPELTNLRSKELSFWCIIKVQEYDTWEYYPNDWQYVTIIDDNIYFVWNWETHQVDIKKDESYYTGWLLKEIVGHPLNRWRICRMHKWGYSGDIYLDINGFFWFHLEMLEQDELQRMESPHREELKPLLIEFSKYF